MAGITLINEDLLLPFTEETPVHANFMNPIIDNVNKNTSAIGQIANDRGYLNSKSLGSDIDLNNFFIQGKYYSSTCLNRPNADAFIIDISGITSANSAITQKATCYYGAGNVNFGKTYERTYYAASGGWTAWKEIATTDKVITTSPWEIPQKIDANNIRTTGIIVTSSYCTNVPGITGGYASTEGFLYTRKFNDAYIVQEFRSIYNNEPKWNRFLFFNNWTPWTAGKQEIPFPFNAGFIQSDVGYACKIVKSDIKQGVIYCGVRKSDGSDFIAHAENAIGTLPTSFLSSFFSMVGAIPSNNLNGAGMLGTARAIIFGQQVYVLTTVNCKAIFFTIPYEIGG